MGNASGQLSYALHLLRLPRTLIGGASLRQVAGYLGKSHELAHWRLDRIDNDARPKVGAIFSYAPAFGLVFPGRCRDCQRFCGNPLCPLLFGVKLRKVMTNDLSARIPLDPFRSRVPVNHMPLRIQHVDRVISNALDQEAEASLGIFKFCLTGSKLAGALLHSLFKRLI